MRNVEKTLKELLKQQRTKVEEIKKKTNYYSTRDLLSKYDDGTPANSPQRPIPGGLQTQQNTPQRQPFPGKNRDPLRTPASQTAQPQRQRMLFYVHLGPTELTSSRSAAAAASRWSCPQAMVR